jgi:hypothetical protein
MKELQKIKIHEKITSLSAYDLYGSDQQIRDFFGLSDAKYDKYSDLTVDFEVEGGYCGDSYVLEIKGHREETDAEFEKRKARAELDKQNALKSKQKQQDAELKELARLKAKYEK